MDVERFKEEFSELRSRFTGDCDKNSNTIGPSLTNQEILEAVQEVLNLKLDSTLVESMREDGKGRGDVKTPASGIVMTTPDAPDIPKLNVEHSGGKPGRFRSLDTLTSESLWDSPVDDLILPEPGSLTSKTEDVETINVPDCKEKNYKSKSSPSVSVLVRSDTFVCEDEFESVKNGDVFEKKIAQPVLINGVSVEQSTIETNLSEILKKLKDLRDSANDVVSKIDDIQNCAPEKARPIRRLSAMGCFPGLNRASTALKTTQRSKMTRRSISAFPGTPTSSRLSPTKDDSARRKSASALSLVNAGGSKLSIPAAYRSVSSGALVVPKKMSQYSSPSQSSQLSSIKAPRTPIVVTPALTRSNSANKSVSRPTKNLKYAHVQSTIPKPLGSVEKRKVN